MAECEICGYSKATKRSVVNSVEFSVCDKCAGLGKVLLPPREQIQSYKKAVSANKEEIIVEDYSQKIKQARERLRLRQDILAKTLGEKLSEIHAVESGRREPSIKLARKIERLLKIELVEEI
jgi:putative transcription factor